MVDALADLEYVLRRNKEPVTLQEVNVLLEWRAHAMRDFTIGIVSGSVITWLATQRLHSLTRAGIALGFGTFCGFRGIKKSVESSIGRILSLEGSRIQGELANIMLNKYKDHPFVLHRLSKYFYMEEVYDDSSLDKPVNRWRFRNFSGHTNSEPQSTSSVVETHLQNNNNAKKDTQPKQVQVTVAEATGATEHPFDTIFGVLESVEHSDNPPIITRPALSRRQRRRERRARHLQKVQSEEDSGT